MIVAFASWILDRISKINHELATQSRSLGHPEALALSEEDVRLLQRVAIFHDAAREGDGPDKPIWEQNSATLCETHLKKIGVDAGKAKKFADLILLKENGGLLGRIFQSADCLHIPRCRKEFYINRMSICEDINDQDYAALMDIVIDTVSIIANQDDLLSTVKIMKDEKNPEVIVKSVSSTFSSSNPRPKQSYEQAKNCYEKVSADYKKYTVISRYYANDQLITAADLNSAAEKKEADLSASIYKTRLDDPQSHRWLIKSVGLNSISPDSSTFEDFILGITQSPEKHHKYALRKGEHKDYTVYGHYAGPRAGKPSPYPPEKLSEKHRFSPHQSTSLVTPEVQTQAFSFPGTSRHHLVGFMFNPDDALLNRMFIAACSTVSRPFEFHTQAEAESYQHQQAKFLFSEIHQFEKAIALNPYEINEVLARIRWNIQSSAIGIFSDTYEARCLAQYYAAQLQNRLKQQFGELQLEWDDSYQIPIVYYLPRQIKNWTNYDKEQQKKDLEKAQIIFSDAALRDNEFKKGNYEFLLLLNNPEDALTTKYQGKSILSLLLSEGLFHLADAIYQRARHTKFDPAYWVGYLKELDPATLPKITRDNETFFESAVKSGKIDYVRAFIEAHTSLANTQDAHHRTLLIRAIQIGNIELVKLLLVYKADIHATNNSKNTALHQAAQSNHTNVITLLLDQGASIDAKNGQNETALHLAIKHTNITVAKELLKANNITLCNIPDNNGQTPVHLAVSAGNIELLELLTSHGFDINVLDSQGNSPLHLAIKKGDPAIIKAVIDCGVDLSIQNSKGQTPTYFAASMSNLEALKILADILSTNHATFDTPDRSGLTPAYYAVIHKDADMLALLIPNNINLNRKYKIYNGYTLMHIAVEKNDEKILSLLINQNTQLDLVDEDKQTPIHLATNKGFHHLLRILLKNKPDINILDKEGYSPIDLALKNQDLAALMIFAEFGYDINIQDRGGNSPVHLAARNNDSDVLNVFIKNGVELDVVDNDRKTALHIASENGCIEALEILAPHIKLDAQDKNNQTAIHLAIECSKLKSLKSLIAQGANINTQNNYGQTPAHIAIGNNEPAALEMLIKSRAKFDIEDRYGHTPVHAAVESNNQKALEILAKHEIKLDIQNNKGKTPAHIAIERNKLDTFKILVEGGINLSIRDKEGKIPLDYARSGERNKFFDLHPHSKGDINSIITKDGNTLLHLAITYHNIPALTKLIERGADLSKENKYGETAIQSAINNRYLDVLEILHQKGIDFVTGNEKKLINQIKNYRDIELKKIIQMRPDLLKLLAEKNEIQLIQKIIETFEKEDNSNILNRFAPLGMNLYAVITALAHNQNIDVFNYLQKYSIDIYNLIFIFPLENNTSLLEMLIKLGALSEGKWKNVILSLVQNIRDIITLLNHMPAEQQSGFLLEQEWNDTVLPLVNTTEDFFTLYNILSGEQQVSLIFNEPWKTKALTFINTSEIFFKLFNLLTQEQQATLMTDEQWNNTALTHINTEEDFFTLYKILSPDQQFNLIFNEPSKTKALSFINTIKIFFEIFDTFTPLQQLIIIRDKHWRNHILAMNMLPNEKSMFLISISNCCQQNKTLFEQYCSHLVKNQDDLIYILANSDNNLPFINILPILLLKICLIDKDKTIKDAIKACSSDYDDYPIIKKCVLLGLLRIHEHDLSLRTSEYQPTILGYSFNIERGVSKTQKISAANDIIDAVNNNQPLEDVYQNHPDALGQGIVGELYEELKKSEQALTSSIKKTPH